MSGMMRVVRLVVLLAVVHQVVADLYLHVPRGSNNRLNENTAERSNANRLFDSQNNDRGGYNVGDKTDKAAGNNEEKQYRMTYFQSGPNYLVRKSCDGGTHLTIEWTNQHGCGANDVTNCSLVLQYMCQDDVDAAKGSEDDKHMTLRNGYQTTIQTYGRPGNLNENKQSALNRRKSQVSSVRGLHEPWNWYDKCYVRERNKGLFTADQTLTTNNGLQYSSSIYTRQNANGNRHGYECPEERDYYPYWHPTPWRDIAVLLDHDDTCQTYQKQSFNVQTYDECIEDFPDTTEPRHYSRWNNHAECAKHGGKWTTLHSYFEKAPLYRNEEECEKANCNDQGFTYKWAIPFDTTNRSHECLVALQPPACQQAPWSRSNHLGNGKSGTANTYTWVLPHFPSQNTKRCVFRMRYNISTYDYDPYNTNSAHNEDKATGIKSPVQGNPEVEVVAGSPKLRLAINTAQFGRTFQDRSHVFKLTPRPKGLHNKRIYNLNVRGKRGNIVQVYPAVEYDFAPNTLQMKDDELVHIQWTGSNTHNNKGAGDAGEGTTGTDRSNMVEIGDMNVNYPLAYGQTSMWKGSNIIWSYHSYNMTAEDLATNLASSGYYECKIGCTERPGGKADLNNLLNNAPASYPGVMLGFSKGTYHYMCTRNNNFSNRDQKANIVVT